MKINLENEIMYQKLLQLEDNVAKLIEFKKRYDSDKIKTDFTLQWALRYGLFEAIQIVIDIACHLVNKYNLGIPASVFNYWRNMLISIAKTPYN